jgi:hypothetical protein
MNFQLFLSISNLIIVAVQRGKVRVFTPQLLSYGRERVTGGRI